MLKRMTVPVLLIASIASAQPSGPTDVILIHNRTSDPAINLTYTARGLPTGRVDLTRASSIDGQRYRLEVPYTTPGTLFTFTMTTRGGQRLVRREIDPLLIHHLDFDNRRRWNVHDHALNWEISGHTVYVALASIRLADGRLQDDVPMPEQGNRNFNEYAVESRGMVPQGRVTYWMAEHFLNGQLDGADEIWTEVSTHCAPGIRADTQFVGIRSILFLNEEKVGEVAGPRYFSRLSGRTLVNGGVAVCSHLPSHGSGNQFVSSLWESVRGL